MTLNGSVLEATDELCDLVLLTNHHRSWNFGHIDVTFLYKGLNGHLNLDFSPLLNCYSQALDPYSFRRDDDDSLKSNLFRISKCKYNNFNRIVKIWNSIPLQVRLTPSLGAFKFGVNVIINMAGDWEGVELVVF